MHGRALTKNVARQASVALVDFQASQNLHMKPFARAPFGGFERRVFE